VPATPFYRAVHTFSVEREQAGEEILYDNALDNKSINAPSITVVSNTPGRCKKPAHQHFFHNDSSYNSSHKIFVVEHFIRPGKWFLPSACADIISYCRWHKPGKCRQGQYQRYPWKWFFKNTEKPLDNAVRRPCSKERTEPLRCLPRSRNALNRSGHVAARIENLIRRDKVVACPMMAQPMV